MMRLRAILLLMSIAAAASADELGPYEVSGIVDVRAVAVDSSLRSFTDGGLGLLRFDKDHDAFQAGRLALDLSGPLTDTVRGQMTVVAVSESARNPLDVTEAFLEWRPYPQSQWRWRTKLGAFYPPISLENRGVAWQSVYSLSPSAINTWIGEEIHTNGMEVTATNSGAATQRPYDVGIVAGIYGWNDPMGVLLFQRGWAIHDRETPLFGDLPRPFSRSPYDHRIELNQEIDDRPGYYGGVEVKWHSGHVLRALHYDNRGNPNRSNRSDTAWLTRFESVGARFELPRDVTLIAQAMWGDTGVGPSADGRGMLIAEYWSYFALASYAPSQHRFTLRYDRMYVESTRGMQFFDSYQDANAWTVAYLYQWDPHWLVGIEGLRVDGELRQRERIGLPEDAVEQQLQIAVRYAF